MSLPFLPVQTVRCVELLPLGAQRCSKARWHGGNASTIRVRGRPVLRYGDTWSVMGVGSFHESASAGRAEPHRGPEPDDMPAKLGRPANDGGARHPVSYSYQAVFPWDRRDTDGDD